MTPEERRERLVTAMMGEGLVLSIDYNHALMAFERLSSCLDQHQPLTAKLLREGDPEGFTADLLRYGFRSHDFKPENIDCGRDCCAGCVVDICQRCGQAADADDWTEFCHINYPEPTAEQPTGTRMDWRDNYWADQRYEAEALRQQTEGVER